MNRLILALGLAACTSAPETAEIPFAVADTAAIVRTNRGLVNIELTSFDDACSIADGRTHPDSNDFRFLLADLDADAAPSGPGTFRVYPLATFPLEGLAARCGRLSYDGTCRIDL